MARLCHSISLVGKKKRHYSESQIQMPITSVRFRNFKGLRDFSVSLRSMNILVGPNNSGKSTVLGAFRLLEQALRTCGSRSPTSVETHAGHKKLGHNVPEYQIPFALENVHHNYDPSNSRLEFRYSNGNVLFLFFPSNGGMTCYWEVGGSSLRTPSQFRKQFPDKVQVIPVLGPLEQNEPIVNDETVRREAGTHRASRHFRNYWYKNPDGFAAFQELIEQTWPGMTIARPENLDIMERRLTMFVSENRIDRELYWSGLGFQIWCQLLTHISRCKDSNMLIVDEPEIYLHPEVQRQLIGILREVHPDIVLATHSVEILSEAEPREILIVDKTKKSARRLQDFVGVQEAIDSLGSIQNISLTELARSRRILFVEGMSDYRILRKFAKLIGLTGLAAGNGLTALESGGFDSWPKIQGFSWGLQGSFESDLKIAVIYDHDYRSDQENSAHRETLERELDLVHFHNRKEIENYLLVPEVLNRAIRRAIEERARRTGTRVSWELDVAKTLDEITISERETLSGQYIAHYCRYFRETGRDQATLASEALEIFNGSWMTLHRRMTIVSGKDTLRKFRDECQRRLGITLSDLRIVQAFTRGDVPDDLVLLLERLDKFRNQEEFA